MIRILITDDHALIREGLRKVFRRESDIEIVAEAQTASEAVARVREQLLDVVVLDFNLPGRSGLAALRQIRELKPQLPILILSMMPERSLALRVFKAGAAVFVSKESAADDIVKAVREAAAGRRYISPAVAQELVSGLGLAADVMPHQLLSDREFQVVGMIAKGHNTQRMVERLSLSIHHRDLPPAHPEQARLGLRCRDRALRNRPSPAEVAPHPRHEFRDAELLESASRICLARCRV